MEWCREHVLWTTIIVVGVFMFFAAFPQLFLFLVFIAALVLIPVAIVRLVISLYRDIRNNREVVGQETKRFAVDSVREFFFHWWFHRLSQKKKGS